MLILTLLARTADTGGKRCFDVITQPDCPEVKNPRTLYKLVFLPLQWKRTMSKKPYATMPTVREMTWFVRGYLRALTGVRPTVI